MLLNIEKTLRTCLTAMGRDLVVTVLVMAISVVAAMRLVQAGDDEYLTTEEVADLLRLPVRTLYAWRYKGFGPRAARAGKRLLYRREVVLKWVRDRECQ
jgi:hypothetical protein